MSSEGLTARNRVRLGGLALGGQIVGGLCVGVFASFIGLASRVWPTLSLPTAVGILFPLVIVGLPLVGAWVVVRTARSGAAAAAVAISSCVLPWLLFAWMVRVTGGERRAVGAVLPALLVGLPLCSIVGGFLGSFVATRSKPVSE
jgi:hypothetical protein